MSRLMCLIVLFLPPLPSIAQEAPVTLDVGAILSLAERPWLDRDLMLAELDRTIGGFRADLMRFDEDYAEEDPWLWSITGQFGTPRADLRAPGGILACSRYGIDTRDLLSEADLSSPRAFRLLGATMAAHDDAEVWPETAVARLSCMFTWDDTRRVSILPLTAVRNPLDPVFEDVTVTGDAEFYGDRWQDYAPVYGEDGYRVDARGGARTSAALVEHMLVELRVTHQRISFRAFLLGGGA